MAGTAPVEFENDPPAMMRRICEFFGRALFKVLSLGLRAEFPFSRFGMYHGIREHARDLQFEGPCLSISHSRHLTKVLGAPDMDFTDADYPAVNILRLPYADGSFGLVVSDQVFEHIEGLPSVAMTETLRVLKPGGWLLHTTCFHTPYHGPGDYWRFTAEGLGELAKLCGAVRIFSGGAGHPVFAATNLLGWSRLLVPKAGWHPLNWLAGLCRPSYATMVWVLAQKEAA